MSKWLALLAVVTWICLGIASPQAQTVDAAATKLAQLLKQTGLSYTTHNAKTWSVTFERTHLGKVKVITSVDQDIVVTFAILATKANIRQSSELMRNLLALNHEYDYAKIGFDKDGDLFVRIDSPTRLIDSAQLKYINEQVANTSEEVFSKNAAFLKR